MSALNIDLIYTEHGEKREMSCAVVGEGKDKLFGPVISVGAITKLAPMLQAHLPERFPDLKSAENYLTFVHFRNMSLRQNSAGVDYPFNVGVPKQE